MVTPTLEQLIEKYPKIFQDYEGNPGRCNWDVPPIWVPIIDDLCACIQYHIDYYNIYLPNPNYVNGSKYDPNDTTTHALISKENYQVTCTQVKEKFGGLRFYTNGNDEQVKGMISYAEHLCWSSCQNCGSREDIITIDGWIARLCKKCANELGKQEIVFI
jgi:hypothetical protein